MFGSCRFLCRKSFLNCCGLWIMHHVREEQNLIQKRQPVVEVFLYNGDHCLQGGNQRQSG
jgi:hypothetical protein